jgi:hypothetical protein
MFLNRVKGVLLKEVALVPHEIFRKASTFNWSTHRRPVEGWVMTWMPQLKYCKKFG